MSSKRIRPSLLASLPALLLVACGGEPVAEPQAPAAEVSEAAVSCYDQCFQFLPLCPEQCQATYSDCYDLTQDCYASCDRGVGPWLPC
ncbi:hypothetical protein [Myxococcus sp. Y35]|uniref:hypothetical protein n=1 Tax=Pseudomyxococcus flavus TaxID=3115648 RepID=UPI003CF4F090